MVSLAKHKVGPRLSKWLAILGIIALAVIGTIWWQRRGSRPNFILVTFDTTRADRMGVYGYEKGLTEAFDDFARRGVIFEKAYAPGPVTLPSHATMLTGLYPPEHGLRVNGAGKLPRDILLLPEILKQHGYDTAAFIAAPVLDSQYGLDRGFDVYDDEFSSSAEAHGEPRRDGKVIVDLALRWLQQRTDRPFFCWIHLYDAHAPYDPRTNAFQQRFTAEPYDAGVAWEVEQFGRVTDYLQNHELQSRTMVVVAGDHGEGLGDHQEDEHGMLVYNTTLHVPFVIVGPEQICQPGTRVSSAVSLVDLTPTLLDVLEIPLPKHLSGRSLAGAMKGQLLEPRDCYAEAESPFILNGWSPLQTIISGQWKYIQTTRPELYDLAKDPGELSNSVATASEECERLRNRLSDMQSAFQMTLAEDVNLSDNDVENLRTLGYIGGSKNEMARSSSASDTLPDVKDFLPYLSKYERAKHLILEGTADQSVEKIGEAIALLEEIVQGTKDFPVAHALLGDCLAQTGRLKEAERTYRELLSSRPDVIRVRFNLGKLLNQAGCFEEAAAELRRYVQENPESATAHFELAEALSQLAAYSEAIQSYRQALRITPEFTAASLQLGLLLLKINQPGEARFTFERALPYDPRSVDLRAHLMMVLAQAGQNEKAIEQGLEIIALQPGSFDTRFNLGLLYFAQRRFADALFQLDEARKLRPEDPRLLPQIQKAEAALQGAR